MSSTEQQAVAVPQIVGAQIVQTGTFYYGYVENPGEWNLYAPNPSGAPRLFDAEIKFPQPFAAPPVVMIAMTGLDADHGANTRIQVASGDVTQLDFEVTCQTWSDTTIYSVWGTWIAIGQA